MKIIEKHNLESKESAVSPVIGVMLMLVVTIIIASVVSVFAGNVFENTESVPSAAVDVTAISNGGDDRDQFVVLIENLGGASIPVSDIRIYAYFSPSDGSSMTRGTTLLSAYTNETALNPGGVITTTDNAGTAALLGWKATDLPVDNSKNTYGIKRYSVIEIEIVHIPSAKTLYSGQVVVQ
jgi:FlaG/FlaF family flagellin (archaellin)